MSDRDGQFGPWLQAKLAERRLSLAQLCRTVGCDYTYLWRIIHAETARGRRYTRPSYDLTRRVGEALGAPREALAAAGYGEETDLGEARVADQMARLESDMAELRANLQGREPATAPGWKAVRLPLLGHVQAGELHEALAHPDDWIELPDFMAGEADFGLRVRGESMNPTLLDGDIVTVRKQAHAEPGQLVVAAIDEEVTLKRYGVEEGRPMLLADNPEYKPVLCGPSARIQGVVTGSYRPPEVLHRRPR